MKTTRPVRVGEHPGQHGDRQGDEHHGGCRGDDGADYRKRMARERADPEHARPYFRLCM
jgi:hypothetical protein